MLQYVLVSQSQSDDPESLQLKARYAIQRGLADVNMLDWVLTDSLRAELEHTDHELRCYVVEGFW